MSVSVINGKVFGRRKPARAVVPSPAECAERAWDRAAAAVVRFLGDDAERARLAREMLQSVKSGELAALREEVLALGRRKP